MTSHPKSAARESGTNRLSKRDKNSTFCLSFLNILSKASLGMLQPPFADWVQTKRHSKQKQAAASSRLLTFPSLHPMPFKTASAAL